MQGVCFAICCRCSSYGYHIKEKNCLGILNVNHYDDSQKKKKTACMLDLYSSVYFNNFLQFSLRTNKVCHGEPMVARVTPSKAADKKFKKDYNSIAFSNSKWFIVKYLVPLLF